MIVMHVGMFASPSRGEEVKGLMRTLRKHAIHAKGLTVAAAWASSDGEPLKETLLASTHILILPDSDSIPDWAVYILGYAGGRQIPAALVGSADLPPALATAEVIDIEEAENYLLAARSAWERTHRIELARARLRGRERDPDAFYRAAVEADRQAVDDFLVVGQPADTRSSEGVPVLVGAVRGRSVEIVQHLLGHGADPNSSSGKDGSSALCEAASRGLDTILGVLLSHDADPNQRTASGQTALMLAASQGHGEIVERLLSTGADPAVRDTLGMSAADYARLFGKQEIIDSLERVASS